MGWEAEQKKYCKEGFQATPGRVQSWSERGATYTNIVELHSTLQTLLSQLEIQNIFRQVLEWLAENPTINKFRRTRECLLSSAAVNALTRSASSIGLSLLLDGSSSLPQMSLSTTNSSSQSASAAVPSGISSPHPLSNGGCSRASRSSTSFLLSAPASGVLHKSPTSNNLASVVLPPTPLPQFPYFSIVRAYSTVRQNCELMAVFKLSTQAGKFGVVKIAYKITRQHDRYLLQQPVAIKIVRDYTTFPHSIPTVDAWTALYPENIYAVERSSEEQALAKYGYNANGLHKAKEDIEEITQLESLKPKYYFTMPWFEGCEFYEVLNFPIDQFNYLEKLQISLALIAALKKLHHAGWVHRDLKAENIILQRLGDGTFVAHLVDLDQARKVGELADFCGTLEYIDPEVLKQAKRNQCKASFEQDIFALGILLAELWVGSSSVLEERLDIINRLIAIDARAESTILREVCEEMFTEIAADRGCLAKDIRIEYAGGEAPSKTITWSDLYFPGKPASLIRDIYRPIKETMFYMMDPVPQKRPKLDAIETAFNVCCGKAKRFQFQSKPCALFNMQQTQLSDLPQIEVPVA